jgi:hypothetical protein
VALIVDGGFSWRIHYEQILRESSQIESQIEKDERFKLPSTT